MHYLPAGEWQPVKAISEPREYLTTEEVERFLLANEVTERAANLVDLQARKLGLAADNLYHFQVHYHADHAALLFPMFDAANQPIGARFRRSDGRKWSFKGGREGIFRPKRLVRTEPLWIAEGPTDAAALHHLGFLNVIGRPSCLSGGAIIQELLEPNKLQPVIIIADNDPHGAGINGAVRLANQLPNPTIVLMGPSDLREFILQNELTSTCRSCIIECMTKDDDEASEWRVVHTNSPGKVYNFARHFDG
jgi:phage/plasmid primase-like uncharacterized protein